MKISIRALVVVYISIFLCLNLIQCSSLGKIAPEYKGVDPKLEHFVKEYKELAAMQGITFKHDITVGFKRLNYPTIGLTTYGSANIWREIDIDPIYWSKATELTKTALAWHELTHAYCTRGHDWGNGQVYPEYSDWNGHEPKEGHYLDGSGCPLSIMYPTILEDFCTITHFSDYVVELFNRCQPY
jgi:hypothetical protein